MLQMISLLSIESKQKMAEAKQTLVDLLEKVAEEQKYVGHTVDVKELSGEGSNITSAIYQATIHSNGKPDLKLFAKVALLNEHARKVTPIACPFTTELYFYKNLQKQFERIENKHAVPEEHRVRMPKLYGSRDEYLSETLVLEDMVAQGFKNFNRNNTADLEYVSTAIELMAKFHALSLGYHADDPVGFRDASEKLTMDTSKIQELIPMMKANMVANALEMVEGDNREKLEKFCKQEDPCPLLQYSDMFKSENLNIFVHGDFKPSNLMHRHRNGKLEIVPVDFQMVMDGGPLRDLMYFIFTATDETFRREHYHAMLDLYHERLREALQRLHVDVEDVYPESTHRAQLKKYSMIGLTMAVSVLPMVLVEEEKLPAFDNEYEVENFLVKGSDLCKERLNGVINNYVEWGLL